MLYGVIINNTATDVKSVVMFLTLREAEIFSDKFQAYLNNGDDDFMVYMNKYGLPISSNQYELQINDNGYGVVTLNGVKTLNVDIIGQYIGRF